MDPLTANSLTQLAAVGGSGAMNQRNANQNQAAISANNQANRNWSEKMYRWGRIDTQNDRDFENNYNSPTQQMKRLKEAGLNPRLIYGGSTGIMSGSNTRSTSVPQPSNQPATRDISGVNQSAELALTMMSQFMALRKTDAETDNVRATRELIEAQTNATKAGIPLTNVNTELAKTNLNVAQKTTATQIEQASANLRKTNQETDFSQSENDRRNVQQELSKAKNTAEISRILSQIESDKIDRLEALQNIAKSKTEQDKIRQEIKHSEKNIELLHQEVLIKKVHNEMMQQGIMPSDPAYSRAFIEAIGRFGQSDTSRSNGYRFEQNWKPNLNK